MTAITHTSAAPAAGRPANDSKLKVSARECRLGPTHATEAVRAPLMPWRLK